jgi:hypothetical protein
MSQPSRPTRVPQVNLLAPPRRGLRLPIPRRVLELVLAAVALTVWGVAILGVAILLGWHP